ncbi:MAG: hypothetical protein JSW07_21095, partial [bacterium]
QVRVMKKFFTIFGIIVVFLLIALITIPLIFKSQLIELVKKEANKNINATLNFEGIGLNLFQNFPNFTLNIKQLTVTNKAPFERDTLVQISSFKTTLDLKSIIKGETVRVVSILLDEPNIYLHAMNDSTVNWDIAKASAEKKPATTTEETSNFALMLQDYEIKNGRIRYHNELSGMKVLAKNFNHKGSGDFTQDQFQLRTNTNVDHLTVGIGKSNYLNKVNTRLKADIDVDSREQKFTLRQNELQINQLLLSFDGFIKMQEEEIIADLTFKTNKNEFKNILSLVPAIYKQNFANLKSAGQIALQGVIRGAYKNEHYPALNLQLSINNGMFQYPQLPSQVSNLNILLDINNAGGSLDNTIIHLKKCQAQINKEPFDMMLLVKTPVSDPHITMTLKGNANLQDIQNLMPSAEGTELTGFVNSDLFVEGNLSNIQKNEYKKYQVRGNVSVKNINYSNPAMMPIKVTVQQANLSFTPERVSLKNFQALLGKGDIRANGTLDNVFPYVLNNEILKGTVTVTSNFFDLNPWIEGESEALQVIEVPGGIDFTLNSNFKEVVFGKLKISNVTGLVKLKDKKLLLMDLNLNLLNGSVVANGSYENPDPLSAHSFFGLKINNFSIAAAFENFLTVQKFVPIARSIQGNFGANLELVTNLDSTLTPVYQSLNSRGALMLQNATVANFKPLDMAADILKMEKLKKLALKNLDVTYKIRDGRFNLSPLNFKVENMEFVLVGSNGIDMSMDYTMKLKVPARNLTNETNARINNFFNRKVDLLQDDNVVFDIFFKGTVDKPDVKISGSEIVKGVTTRLKDIAKQEIEQKKVMLADTVKAEIEKQKQVLEEMKKEAQQKEETEAEKLKKEAESQLKSLFKKKKK